MYFRIFGLYYNFDNWLMDDEKCDAIVIDFIDIRFFLSRNPSCSINIFGVTFQETSI